MVVEKKGRMILVVITKKQNILLFKILLGSIKCAISDFKENQSDYRFGMGNTQLYSSICFVINIRV